jgi:1,4-dihydroxy-6-naphthoate synthase
VTEREVDRAESLDVGYSPCPNDTFIFHALVTGLVPSPGVRWRPRLADVETLNELAFRREIPVTKLSFHALGRVRQSYVLLSSGAALGRGCGPLVVRRAGGAVDLSHARIAIPGRWTTAALLLRLHAGDLPSENLVPMTFDRILPSVAAGEVDAGLIIHESRFTYRQHGLEPVVDLGEWWERETGLPIPLGGIAGDRSLGEERLRAIDATLRRSVLFAMEHPDASREYVRSHAQEIEPDVISAHIALYVNDFTVALGREGTRAIEALFEAAEARGIVPPFRGKTVLGP